MITLQALALKETMEPVGPLQPKHPVRVLNRITLCNSTAGKCTHMQVIKQSEHGRISTTKEQKRSSFQTNYD